MSLHICFCQSKRKEEEKKKKKEKKKEKEKEKEKKEEPSTRAGWKQQRRTDQATWARYINIHLSLKGRTIPHLFGRYAANGKGREDWTSQSTTLPCSTREHHFP